MATTTRNVCSSETGSASFCKGTAKVLKGEDQASPSGKNLYPPRLPFAAGRTPQLSLSSHLSDPERDRDLPNWGAGQLSEGATYRLFLLSGALW